MLKKDVPNGVIIYEGPSVIDGEPIVVIANSFKTNKNRKIGDMIQTWILRSDIHPNDALKSGDDFSICGDCIHRGKYVKETDTVTNRTCYVNLYQQGVFSIYNAYKRGSYPVCDIKYLQLFRNRHVRIGSYGDPAAVPIYVWDSITKFSKDYTGYTHQWKFCDYQYSMYCMASCETETEQNLADIHGWRTFRIIKDVDTELIDGEMRCPAQTHGTHCDKCGICNGSMSNRKNIVVVFHGAQGREKQYLSKVSCK